MRKLLLSFPLVFLFLLISSSPAHAQMTYSGHHCETQNGGQASTVSCVLNNTSGAGHINIFYVNWCHSSDCNASGSGDSITSVVDGNGTATCIAATRANNTGSFAKRASEVCYFNSIASNASNTVTVTLSSSLYYAIIGAGEFSGQATSSVVDQTATSVQNCGPTCSFNTPATTQANEMVFGGAEDNHGCCAPFVGTGYSNLGTAGNSFYQFKIVSATGAQAFTWAETGTNDNSATVATFKAASPGGAVRHRSGMM